MENRHGFIEEELIESIKNVWKCSHTDNGKAITQNGWCPRCGCAADDYKFEVGEGDDLIIALDGYAFEHNGRRIWYKNALYRLKLMSSPTPPEEQWQSVEEAEERV